MYGSSISIILEFFLARYWNRNHLDVFRGIEANILLENVIFYCSSIKIEFPSRLKI